MTQNKSLQHLAAHHEQQQQIITPNQQSRIPSTSVSMSALKQVPYSMPMPGVAIGGKGNINILRKKQQQ